MLVALYTIDVVILVLPTSIGVVVPTDVALVVPTVDFVVVSTDVSVVGPANFEVVLLTVDDVISSCQMLRHSPPQLMLVLFSKRVALIVWFASLKFTTTRKSNMRTCLLLRQSCVRLF